MWTVFIPTLYLLLVTATATFAFTPSYRRVVVHHHHPPQLQRLPTIIPRSFPTFLSVGGSSSSSSSSTSITDDNEIITLQLTKPLGMILEEMEGASGGVVVTDVNDTGSAGPYATQIQQTQIVSINNVNVRSYTFDQMMSTIGELPTDEVVTMEFQKPRAPLQAGTDVTISVLTSNGETISIPAKVGDNLRQTLLNNNIEVYQGMQKISNCGGAGQCTLCAFDFVSSESSWEERSDYESSRLKKFPTARLTCLNPIQGPATVRKTQR